MWVELLALITGASFWYLRSGKEDQVVLIKQGLVLGVILGFILGVLSIFTPSGMSIRAGIEGAVGISVRVIILALIFVIGVMIGDYLEIQKKKWLGEGHFAGLITHISCLLMTGRVDRPSPIQSINDILDENVKILLLFSVLMFTFAEDYLLSSSIRALSPIQPSSFSTTCKSRTRWYRGW